MQFRKICDNTSDMSMTELAHNPVFIKDGECWYRDFDREISLRNLMREICSKYGSPATANEMNDDTLDEMLYDNLSFGTDDLKGVFALLNMTMWGMAEVREWLKEYEEYGPPTTRYGKWIYTALIDCNLSEVRCSECDFKVTIEADTAVEISEYKYCPNCGAKMKEV